MLKLLRKIYSLGHKNRLQINISIILQFIDSFLIFVPVGTAMLFFKFYIEGTLTSDTPLVLFMFLISGVILRVFTRYYIDKNQYSTLFTIFSEERVKIGDHLKKVKMGFYTDDNVGKITNILTNGIGFIEEHGMMSVVTCLTSITSIVMISITLSVINLTTGLIFIATVLVSSIVLYFYHKRMLVFTELNNVSNETLSSSIIEYTKNISVIKAFNLLGKHERSNETIIERKRVDLLGERINVPFLGGALIIMALGSSLMIYSAVNSYVDSGALLYNVIILCILSLYVFNALQTIAFKIALINISVSQLDLIDSLYNEDVMKIKGDKVPKDYSIEFEHVSFAYEKENILDDISFKLEENSMTALVGKSGSGKSTIVNLIPRFFDINKGSIKIGGVDIREMSAETLYSSISMVFQDVYLFKDTIYNNIAFGNDAVSREQVIDACKKARCYDFISNLEDGLDTIVGEAGMSLSGGERQRISIARAILKDSPIILLDEATASIDPDNEYLIQEAINALVKNKTLVVIAHKLSCVQNSKKILVVNDGKIVNQGTHEDLIKESELYSNLWNNRVNSKSWKIMTSYQKIEHG
ncbi:MAG: ABC transporter ATP-binding protein [Cyclobacteriaceae bacterium]